LVTGADAKNSTGRTGAVAGVALSCSEMANAVHPARVTLFARGIDWRPLTQPGRWTDCGYLLGGKSMRHALAIFVLVIASNAEAQQQNAPEVKLLTPAECEQITKRPEGDFFVKGPVKIGMVTIENSNVPPHGIVMNGIDNFDVIQRSCFNGKPS
jgi:hypothetical protein